jgi:prepilin-type processing-associated H-X9-DG protein
MPGRIYPEWTIELLRRRILGRTGRTGRGIRRLYVSRAGAGHRRVTNEPEIVTLLEGHGFEPVLLEKLPFRDQVSLFRDAEIVVAPHGGGLANLVFCDSGTRVIELFPAANIDLYYRLSVALGLRYFFVKSREGPREAMGPADYRIEPGDLSAALTAAGASG